MDKRINIMFWAGALFGVLGLISVVLDWPDLLSWTLIGLMWGTIVVMAAAAATVRAWRKK